MSESPTQELRDLARSYGVQLEYVGMDGKTAPAPAESLLAVLRASGADVASEADAPRALAERKNALWQRRVEPVVVAWDGVPPTIQVRLPADLASSTIRCSLGTESGRNYVWKVPVGSVTGSAQMEEFVNGRIDLGDLFEANDLPAGYHCLTLGFEDGQSASTLLISAPTRAYQGPDAGGKRPWGIFSPLYALHREGSWGAGDFSDLEALIDWTSARGGGLVASLPMLASNFDGPSPIISPYSPTSRVFWNEFYLDLGRIPELASCQAARALLASDEASSEVADLKASGLVDYGRQMRLKRKVLELLAYEVVPSKERSDAFLGYVRAHREVESYALFQAAGERHGRDWRAWPTGLDRSDVDDRAYRYHLYAQWQADEQLKALSAKAREKGMVWYLDFPIGVDFNSFDVWTHRDVFATGASVGCPPDPVFTKGQNWGFPPMHPERQRESGYAYLIASIRSHLKYANALRIDHVMGLHRLFWIPQGMEAKNGAFVSTPSEEIYAILSVESHRHSAWLVGEDLGTVPPEVEGAMKRHNVRGMYVVQYEARPDPARTLREVPESTVASLNTHDMPPFAAFWAGLDLDDRKDLGLMTSETLEQEKQVREQQRSAVIHFLRSEGFLADEASDAKAVVQALWRWLATSPSSVLLLNLEDLWLETEPQNTPNTYDERPNWRRKLRRSFEQFADDPAFLAILKQVDELRAQPACQA
jgi:4-alpha-glucanotransferase